MPDRSELELHAAIWRKAARVVAGMDERNSWPTTQGTWISRAYSSEEATSWSAYANAARVLHTIAEEYEKAAETKEPA